MKRQPVTSTQIVSLGWEPNETGVVYPWPTHLGVLEVEFHRGQVYRYADVPHEVYRRLLVESAAAEEMAQKPSVGRLFDVLVKKAGFQYSRVTDAVAQAAQQSGVQEDNLRCPTCGGNREDCGCRS